MSKQTVIITPDYPGGATRSHSTQVAAPGPYVRNGDFLRLNASSTDASVTLVLSARLLRPDGEIVPLTATMPITGTGNQTPKTVPLVEGWIVGLIVYVSAGTITDGEVVASVEVVQGSGTPGTRVMCLASGEVSNTRSLGLGAFTICCLPTAEPTVTTTTVALANPAVGDDAVFTVPAATKWVLVCGTYQLVTQAAVGAAAPLVFILSQDTTTMWQYSSNQVLGAGVTGQIGLSRTGGFALAPLASAEQIAIPDVTLVAGDTVTYSWRAGAGVVSVTAPRLVVEATAV